jgi:hypothetical protein
MFETKWCNMLLKMVPQKNWNTLSKCIAMFSRRTIGSPVELTYKNFVLKEYQMHTMDEEFKETFLKFCYPADLHDRDKEIECDKIYWGADSTFVIFDTNKQNEIVGCAQFIPKTDTIQIPAEYARLADNQYFDPVASYNSKKIGEIYRCRRSFDLRLKDSIVVVSMLFKALWAKTIQTKTEYLYITFDLMNRELKNLYTRKLFFQNPETLVHYGNDTKDWQLLYKDCMLHEKKFATLDKSHFYLQTWFRQNLKQKKLRTTPETATTTFVIEKKRSALIPTQQPDMQFGSGLSGRALPA